MARIMLTGGAGFIGSHTAVVLLERGYDIVLLDDFSNAARDVPDRLRQITGIAMPVIEADIRDPEAMRAAFAAFPVDAVVHFAAKKAVGESEADPLLYFDVNILGTIRLLAAMRDAGVGRLVFSSSATVYGEPDTCPISETASLRVTNVYGRTKMVMEGMIEDLSRTGVLAASAILRYFNPVGAHPSGLIGENPRGVPANLMPYLCQVAAGQRPYLTVFGNDYPTHDGTGVRDFIHVMDLAEAHAAAVDRILAQDGGFTVNLGTGTGYSVLDLVHAFKAATGIDVPYQVGPRRPGDVAACYADPGLAASLLGWRASRGVQDMCRDAWRWQSRH
ncbi:MULTISPECIES: UDP-glucose 4-epimerase GalE [Acidiphilium]|jgi:UDP-glucose 4-epimerase|uniref:UDP-glucose 4-epimerase n=2 Tax=Acidiphilium TaxID=522 RepID=A5FUH1_ACICJ|nr:MULTISPECIES: UDP-glucose 4-epimerase GalE [Acidiphilium]MBU6357113.1 UDP-glucose 4-epimerase GalE [Rhodospirillales bacterium]ABQ29253.1 UDP-galactose 4-epimerase [Acidiphilium cryptum JF-5]EGO96374.1 UDP-glucose 4-epimerase [Acidiphilium sp. PM]KDM68572.1 UDP-glucose 4-epimerase GalE [Acidiphilium sp. JA12-A1]MBS3023439.1 UDP-glucose 4-epimerase GalE [Acidiphilium multivorum]